MNSGLKLLLPCVLHFHTLLTYSRHPLISSLNQARHRINFSSQISTNKTTTILLKVQETEKLYVQKHKQLKTEQELSLL